MVKKSVKLQFTIPVYLKRILVKEARKKKVSQAQIINDALKQVYDTNN